MRDALINHCLTLSRISHSPLSDKSEEVQAFVKIPFVNLSVSWILTECKLELLCETLSIRPGMDASTRR